MGMIYKRGNVWWIKYYRNGKSYRESSTSTKKMVAKKLLDRREGDIAQGKLPGVHFEKITYDQLAESFIRDYRINQKKSLVRAERSVNHLNQFFEGIIAPAITTPVIDKYIEMRMGAGAANATINRELSALKRMLNLGAEQTPPLVDKGQTPKIKMLDENNVRKGFFEHDQFLAVRSELPEYLRNFVTIAYKEGWRLDEIETLTWDQVDRKLGIIRLEPGETKNDDARVSYLDDEEKEMIEEQWALRKKALNIREVLLPWVFLNRYGTDRIKQFHKSWKKACNNAGVPGKIFHDFRRSAIRNMVRAGVSENVAMKISGHKTRSVFERYNIVNDADLINAVKKRANYLDNISSAGTISGTVVGINKI
ncbi:tyrosine-type recombinase/integrase, partial [Thermodesulfobacteriota bacterium]